MHSISNNFSSNKHESNKVNYEDMRLKLDRRSLQRDQPLQQSKQDLSGRKGLGRFAM